MDAVVDKIRAELRRKKMTKKDIAAALGIDEALLSDETLARGVDKMRAVNRLAMDDGRSTNMSVIHNNLPADVRSARIRYTTADGRRVFLSTDEAEPEPGEERGDVNPDYLGRVYADLRAAGVPEEDLEQIHEVMQRHVAGSAEDRGRRRARDGEEPSRMDVRGENNRGELQIDRRPRRAREVATWESLTRRRWPPATPMRPRAALRKRIASSARLQTRAAGRSRTAGGRWPSRTSRVTTAIGG